MCKLLKKQESLRNEFFRDLIFGHCCSFGILSMSCAILTKKMNCSGHGGIRTREAEA